MLSWTYCFLIYFYAVDLGNPPVVTKNTAKWQVRVSQVCPIHNNISLSTYSKLVSVYHEFNHAIIEIVTMNTGYSPKNNLAIFDGGHLQSYLLLFCASIFLSRCLKFEVNRFMHSNVTKEIPTTTGTGT